MTHLGALAEKHGTRVFYFSQDSVAPKTVLKLARAIRDEGLPWRWGTDMRPERYLTPERCAELAEGGALAMALGVESAAPRVLGLIDKGIPVEDVRAAIEHLADAGVAVEAMCFADFPTESYREALATVRFLEELRGRISLFICGEFDLTHGALVAQRPQEFGIREARGLAALEEPPAPLARWPILTVGASIVVLAGEPILDPARPGAAVATARLERERSAAGRAPLLVAIEAGAPWSAAAAVMDAAAAAGWPEATLVFDAKSAVAPPPASSIHDRLAPADATRRASTLTAAAAPLPSQVFADCRAALDLLSSAASLPESEKLKTLALDLPRRLETCGCQADLAAVRALAWAWFGRFDGPPKRGVKVRLAARDDAAALTVSAAPATSWSEAHRAVLEAARQDRALRFESK